MKRAALGDKVRNVLNESRILVLGAQVLVGFQFRAVFEDGFGKLPPVTRWLMLANLALMLVAVGLLIAPAAYHRIVERGIDNERLYLFTSDLMAWALLPFALGLGISFYVVAEKLFGSGWAVPLASATCAVALFFWYGLELIQKRRLQSHPPTTQKQEPEEQTPLSRKIEHVLTEARLVLPGAQALLGFQFITILMKAFDQLPKAIQHLHLISLGAVALSVIFLMTPAAYHRLVEQGEESERFHRFATGMVLAAMGPLGLGICGDFFVVSYKVTESLPLSTAAAAIALLFFWGLWFGLMIFLRARRGGSQ